jgi:MFS family permease
VAVLILFVREPATARGARGPSPLRSAGTLGGAFWIVALVSSLFTLARFSEAFLVLRAASVGLSAAWVPLVLVTMNVVYALSAYPAGAAADRTSPRTLLALGLGALIAADLVLAAALTPLVVFGGVALWGLHMGLTQGLQASLLAATAPADLRGTAFGLFNVMTGVVLLLASVIAGLLWSRLGPSATFIAGAIFTAFALAGLVRTNPAHPVMAPAGEAPRRPRPS